MTILLEEYFELDDRASKHLKTWKVWHTTLYVLAAIFGIMNYTFLFQIEHLVDNHCVFYPRKLEFRWVELNSTQENTTGNDSITLTEEMPRDTIAHNIGVEDIPNNVPEAINSTTVAQTTPILGNQTERTRREVTENTTSVIEKTVEEKNVTIITENKTHRLMLYAERTLFPPETDSGCQFAEYMPLLSAAFAIVWLTLFIMCPSGGRATSGLQEPWRILTPALLFAFMMVILTGYSFTSTNGGLQAFCAAFHNYTNTTACSAVNPFLERAWNESWGVGSRISATRAASAGVWASWACAAAVLLARCLAASDFVVRRTAVTLVSDPYNKVTPYLVKKNSTRRSNRSAQSSPTKRDTASLKSEPTNFTELVTASVEHEPDSQPTSLATTPLRGVTKGEDIEMTYNPQELK